MLPTIFSSPYLCPSMMLINNQHALIQPWHCSAIKQSTTIHLETLKIIIIHEERLAAYQQVRFNRRNAYQRSISHIIQLRIQYRLVITIYRPIPSNPISLYLLFLFHHHLDTPTSYSVAEQKSEVSFAPKQLENLSNCSFFLFFFLDSVVNRSTLSTHYCQRQVSNHGGPFDGTLLRSIH